jgi:hypothetical protein
VSCGRSDPTNVEFALIALEYGRNAIVTVLVDYDDLEVFEFLIDQARFQLKYVAWLIPALRQIFATGIRQNPASE